MSDRIKVIVDPSFRAMDEIFSPADAKRLHATVDVVWGRDEPMPPGEATVALADATAVVCCGWRYGRLSEDFAKLRAIIDVAGHFPKDLDYEACYARGIRVLSAAPAFGYQVAEMALGLALAASREITAGDRAMRDGSEGWLHAGNVGTFLLRQQPVGFIGFGAIARFLKPLLAPFDTPITAYDPWLSDGYLRSCGVEPMALDRLLSTSRIIFVLAAPSGENRALLSRELLSKIRPGSVLVLISRAHVVDFDALTEFVLEGRFKAAIDVFPTEPVPLDHPIRQAPGAILSAHRAGSVKEGLWDLGEMVVDDLEAIARDLPPQRLQVAAPELIGRLTTVARSASR